MGADWHGGADREGDRVHTQRLASLRRPATNSQLDPDFKYEVAAQPGGEKLFACFACGSCSAGCPVREIDNRYNPRRILRMVLLGLREQVLASEYLWLCSTCYTCQERCPQGVKIADLMMVLRNLAAKSGHLPAAYRVQLDLLRANGRLYEIDDFDNKRRVKIGLPEIPMRSDEVKAIFEITGADQLMLDSPSGSENSLESPR